MPENLFAYRAVLSAVADRLILLLMMQVELVRRCSRQYPV
jgi:hypothetical protein